MLVIRSEQLHALREAREAPFVDELAAHVRRHFPSVAEASSEASLRATLCSELERARSYGLEERSALVHYVCLGAVLGWGFDALEEHAWIVALLRDESIASPSHRVRLAVKGLAQRLEREEQRRLAELRFESASLASTKRPTP